VFFSCPQRHTVELFLCDCVAIPRHLELERSFISTTAFVHVNTCLYRSSPFASPRSAERVSSPSSLHAHRFVRALSLKQFSTDPAHVTRAKLQYLLVQGQAGEKI
jgi:hypothetical protein